MNLQSIVQQFSIEAQVKEIKPWGKGHINDTYKVSTELDEACDYVLQRVNTQVFTNVNALLENAEIIDQYLKITLPNEQLIAPNIPAKDQKNYIRYSGNVWRMYAFIDDSVSYERAETPEISRIAGESFGRFLMALNNLNVTQLHTIIPDFHNLSARLHQFEKARTLNLSNRLQEAEKEISILDALSDEFKKMYQFAVENFPLRITHNDTKFNNLLINIEQETATVIDLDTVMPGYAFFDVGDTLRSGMVNVDEDEEQLDEINILTNCAHSFLEAYLQQTDDLLTHEEQNILPNSAAYMAFIMGVRFLTDFLNGDTYYKTRYASHNLIRARCQFRVCELFREFRF